MGPRLRTRMTTRNRLGLPTITIKLVRMMKALIGEINCVNEKSTENACADEIHYLNLPIKADLTAIWFIYMQPCIGPTRVHGLPCKSISFFFLPEQEPSRYVLYIKNGEEK